MKKPPHNSSEIGFSWLIRMRWLAIFGQLTTILLVYFYLHIPISLAPLFMLMAITVLTNLFFANKQSGNKHVFGGLLVLDTLLLTGLLYFTGGPSNPFSVLYLVHVALAAVTLERPWSWSLALLSVSCFALLFFFSIPLPGMAAHDSHDFSFHLKGMWIAFTLASVLIASMVGELFVALKRREKELSVIREQAIRQERLLSLATLAAGAAHELNTPLSTIAVITKELEKEMPPGNTDLQEDLRLIRTQVERCRTIINQLGNHEKQNTEEINEKMNVVDFISHLIQTLSPLNTSQIHFYNECQLEHLSVRKSSLEKILTNLIRNALDASSESQKIRLVLRKQNNLLQFVIEDEGGGMNQQTLDHAFEPFHTTKEPGKGMGLGLFLSRISAENLGGKIALESHLGKGTKATLQIPL